ncbi:hypothetical protein CCO03_17795 [Comamonas serinivorans]|uniref:2OG-Fe dioxygenase family protein n=1 Tax=Comamonas serinivorans TaxID=1082851 RepID=A0A1Y0EST2_9BURK|nr:2OG-Fe dioxygenase family protein [Comamonas serinivorans]ARU06282.1 hypothetical protein CCO03_17795 [Comamonas serinivorans]
MPVDLSPPLTPADAVLPRLHSAGYAVLDAVSVAQLAGVTPADLQALVADWDHLPPDPHLKDGGRYRRRRHASFVVDDRQAVHDVPHRAHWQPVAYNALHGGMARWFDPIAERTRRDPAWRALLVWLSRLADGVRAAHPVQRPEGVLHWFGEAHQFRIDTASGIGRPTPEGAHRDGVDLVAVFLIDRQGIKGGETRVFEAQGPHGVRFTLSEPWSVLLLDDARVIHESTPIQPMDTRPGHRDTLVVTLRQRGFPDDQV